MERINISGIAKEIEEPRGYSDKYWINDEIKRLIKFNGPACPDQDVMESISSDILKILNIDTVNVQLGYNKDSQCCIIDSFLISPADITINLLNNSWSRVNTNDEQKNISSCFYKMFNIFKNLMNINDSDLENMKRDYIRMIFGDCIIDNEDRRLKNVEAIYNEHNFSYRLAPSFDNGLAFNAFNIGSEESYCYIGNQDFPANLIIEYIIKRYLEDVIDIVENLDKLVNENLEAIISKYSNQISKDKLIYIYNYINSINQIVKEMIMNNSKTKH